VPLYKADIIRLYGVDFIYDFFLIEIQDSDWCTET
jgi:hypothetical protein